jgi:hypothetical protein
MRRQSGFGGARVSDGWHRHFAMANTEGLDPALLPKRERDEVPELDDLLLAEVRAQSQDQGTIDAGRVPNQMARVKERDLLAVVEAV